jgi:hypothetical protein
MTLIPSVTIHPNDTISFAFGSPELDFSESHPFRCYYRRSTLNCRVLIGSWPSRFENTLCQEGCEYTYKHIPIPIHRRCGTSYYLRLIFLEKGEALWLRIRISYNFNKIVDSQITKFMHILGIEMLRKCHILKTCHVIEATRKNFSSKRLLHFCRDISYLEEIITPLIHVVGLNYKSLHVVLTWIQRSVWLA